jgi:uncharacterized membrane protein
MKVSGVTNRQMILALASVGVVLSLALEHVHYRAHALPTEASFCALSAHFDCAHVAVSKYGIILGIPLPLWGVVGFVAIALAAWRRSQWLLPLTSVAALASVVLIGVSAFALGAFCLLCEGVHLVSFALFLLAWRARNDGLAPYGAREPSAMVLGPPLGILLALALFLPAYWGAFSWKGEIPFAQGKTEDGHPWIGAREPKLTLEEFIDYSCPHCRAASTRTLMSLAEHPDELRVVRRHLPSTPCLPRSETRCLSARIALCAEEQEKFWQADRWLFEHSVGGQAPDLEDASRTIGLDRARLGECIERDATFERAAAEWKRAKKLRLPGTPYYAHGKEVLPLPKAFALIDAL